MKKVIIALLVLVSTFINSGVAQTSVSSTANTPMIKDSVGDFFAGKWNILFIGTPNGDSKLVANFTRKDGKLTGELTDPSKPDAEKIPLTNVEEEKDKIVIYFSAQGYDLSADLSKVDDNNLKGMLFSMFEAKATRIVEK